MYHFLHLFIYLVAKPVFRYKTFGAENIPPAGTAAILASNHVSYVDPFFVGLGVIRRINYLAKKELFSRPLISFLLRNLFMTIPVDREQMERTTLKEIYRRLANKEILLMFPEGTRSPDGKLQEGKLGIGMIAYHTKVPLIPVYIKGSHYILPRDSKRIRVKPCSVYFGPPVDLSDLYRQKKSKEIYKAISSRIMEAIGELEKLAGKEDCVYSESVNCVDS